ncbi:hypothetical protein FT663_01852 [Candidozyma haemuli var. vulneris]|nr:hypothetical protein FT663_01852 [[Candida] haemuloni var. vulneris]KAF3993881.1 hypothetical protein FT662_00329 [[Candida] haemuloni var. vulneris]
MNTHMPISRAQQKRTPFHDVKFNQDQDCFAVAHEMGFSVYNTNPIDPRVSRTFSGTSSSGTGIGLISMLHRTNYVALVGGGKNPKYPNNKVIIWDDLKRKASLNLGFMGPVVNVLLSRIRIVVVLKNQVVVYEFSAPPKKFASYETYDNEHGLADLSVHSSASQSPSPAPSSSSSLRSGNGITRDVPKYQILAFPGRTVGQIQIVDVSPEGSEKNLVSIIKAHKARIRCICLSRTGNMVASASETGTIIRIHSTTSTALLFEFRRGLDRAIITSMSFSPNDSKLAVLSDKNTLHVFNVGPSTEPSLPDQFDGEVSLRKSPTNRQHILSKLQLPIGIPQYFQSTWSFCSVNISKYHTDFDESSDISSDIGTVGWSGNSNIIIIWKEKRIWENYSIVEKVTASTNKKKSDLTEYELVRSSWKSLDEVSD